MTEEAKTQTEEEKLIAAAAGGGKSTEGGEGDGGEELSPEQKLIADLQGKLAHSEERAKTAEEQRDAERVQKDAARNQAKTAAERQVHTQEEAINSALNAAKSGFESAQKEWDDAYDAGDKARIRTATEKLNDAQMKLRGAEYQTEQFKTWKEKTGGVVDTGESRFTKAEQEWIGNNPRFNTDRKFRAAVYAAHEEAQQKGIKVDSPEYFENIEDYLKDLGLKGERKADPEPNKETDPPKKEEQPKKSEKQSSSTAAPVGGSTGSNSGNAKKQTFHMTSEHREAAAICYPDLHKKSPKEAEEKYAKAQLEIQQKRARGEQV